MLSLGRTPGQYIVIGDNIVVSVVSVDGDLRLAIDAPKDVPIVRGEVYEQTRSAPLCVKRMAGKKEAAGKDRKSYL